MNKVPRDRHVHLKQAARRGQKAIFIGGVPIPTGQDDFSFLSGETVGLVGVDERDEIAGQTELVRTLPRSRFRNSLSQEISLPDGVAVRLEDLEEGLRSAGFIGPGEIISQRVTTPSKFRVQKRNVSVDGHFLDPSVGRGSPSGSIPRPTEGHHPLHCGQSSQGGTAERPLTGLNAVPLQVVHRIITRRRRTGF